MVVNARMTALRELGARRVALALSCGVALCCVGLAWSLASPIGASPDDDFHLATIWCLTGDRELCQRTGEAVEEGIERVIVAPGLPEGMPCFAMRPVASAACQVLPEPGSPSGPSVSRANDGLYPDGFYRLMSLFVSADVGRSVVVMRMVSWLLASALMAAAFLLAERELRRAFVLAALTTLVPLGVFLFASTNPSGVAVAGVAAYWCAAYAFLSLPRVRSRRALAVVGILLTASVVALVSRADAGLFLALASIGAWISTGGHRTFLRARSSLLLGITVVGGIATVRGRQSQRWAGELGAEESNSLAADLFEAVLEVPRRVLGALGVVELGWLDTPMPALVSILMVLAFGGVVVLGLGAPSREKWLALAAVSGAVVSIATIVLVSGQNVQPRYLLPLLPVVAGTALATQRGADAVVIRRGQALVVVGAIVVAHAAALHRNIRRYVTGIDEGGPDLGEAAEWWWSFGPGPMAIWLLGALAFAVLGACAVPLIASEPPAGSSEGEPRRRVELDERSVDVVAPRRE